MAFDDGMRHILHLALGDFFVAVERAANPALADRPLVVGGRPGGRGLVAAASAEARAQGVRPGMTAAAAASLCPGAIFVEGRVGSYCAATVAVDGAIRRHAGRIEWTSIDEAYLDVGGGPAHARRVAEAIQASIQQAFGFDVACGLGTTRTVAAVASSLARPRGLIVVLPGYEARFLAPLPLDRLPDLDVRQSERLRAAGLRTIGDVAALGPAAVSALIGPAGAALARRAAALDDEPVRPAAPRAAQPWLRGIRR
jgi:DNA polymerase-4